jgi:hypothetical protein
MLSDGYDDNSTSTLSLIANAVASQDGIIIASQVASQQSNLRGGESPYHHNLVAASSSTQDPSSAVAWPRNVRLATGTAQRIRSCPPLSLHPNDDVQLTLRALDIEVVCMFPLLSLGCPLLLSSLIGYTE